jgi:hypothetical protein
MVAVGFSMRVLPGLAAMLEAESYSSISMFILFSSKFASTGPTVVNIPVLRS